MYKQVLIVLLLVLLMPLTACNSEAFQDNQVYIVEQGSNMEEDTVVGWLDVNGLVSFRAENIYQQQLAPNQLFLTASIDGTQIFYEEVLPERDPSVLIGQGAVQVNVYLLDQTTQTVHLIASQRPFVARTGWNQEKKLVAFGGDGALTVYDVEEQKVVSDEDLTAETVTSFFWSPLESRKLYVEQPRNAIGTLYYMEPVKKAELYETAERIYYKAQLDENYFYGTCWGTEQEGHDAIYTVVANADKETIKVIGEGSYRDHYLRSVLLNGENNFGLTYIANINQVSKSVLLTDQYVYDAKFVAGGRLIYTTDSANRTQNQYVLHLVDGTGTEIQKWTVSGSSVLLSEDGKSGYGSGPEQELISFDTPRLQRRASAAATNPLEPELEHALRGASRIYAELLLGVRVSQEDSERFYANLEGLEQIQKAEPSEEKQMTFDATLLATEVNEEGMLCTVRIVGLDDRQQTMQQRILFQMIEQNHNWYVLHFETGETGEEPQ